MSLEDFPNFSILFFSSLLKSRRGRRGRWGLGKEGATLTPSNLDLGGIQFFCLTGKLDFILYSL